MGAVSSALFEVLVPLKQCMVTSISSSMESRPRHLLTTRIYIYHPPQQNLLAGDRTRGDILVFAPEVRISGSSPYVV